MLLARHLVEWHGDHYTIEPLKSISRLTALSPVWAVFHRGEFIGTLPYRQDESVNELEARCATWLQDLLEAPRRRAPA